MITLTLRGNQIGEGLQFDSNGRFTSVEFGRVWFAATDTVTLTLTSQARDPATGAIVGGAGTVLGLTVTTADGRVTTFTKPTNPLDIDPDQSKQGSEFFYISESPAPGMGGAYAGLQLEKLVISATPVTAGTTVPYAAVGGFTGVPAVQPPAAVTLTGNSADNVLIGNDLANVMSGRDGNDTMSGRGGNDTMSGGNGNDRMDGGSGHDWMSGGNGNDRMDAGSGNDSMSGGSGNDTMYGRDGRDTLSGGNGNDRMDGGSGNDSMSGGAGNDRMLGGSGADRLKGGAGNDLLDGGSGRDILTGGLGGDSFVFGNGDRVTDFKASEGDQIVFDERLGLGLEDIRVIRDATGTTIAYGAQTMRLDGVTERFDLGNAIKFDYQNDFDFL